jgi:ribosomal protein S18 acetylase RimI-like enzyme
MKSQNVQDKIILRKLNSKLASELKPVFRSNSEDTSVLNVGLMYKILESIRLLPHSTRLVAYHTEDRVAVGFITLEKNSKTLFSIKDVFVDPRYRRMGIASHLLDRALTIAKQKGAKKLNLNVDPSKNSVIRLYSDLGFREIGYASLFQGFFSSYSPIKVLKRTVLGQRTSKKATVGQKNRLTKLSVSDQNRAKLFDIFQNNVGKDWLDFFEINSKNFTRGSSHVWHPNMFKDSLIRASGDSFAFIFHQPYPPKDTIELYRGADVPVVPLLEDLIHILPSRGTGLTQIWLYGKTDDVPADWLKDRAFMAFSFLGMGKNL